MPDRLTHIRHTLEAHGQDHLLAFADELSPERREDLLDQIESLDLAAIDGWIKAFIEGDPPALVPDDLTDIGGGACFNDARVEIERVS